MGRYKAERPETGAPMDARMDAGQPGLKEQPRLDREVVVVVDVVAVAVVSLPGRKTGNWRSNGH